MKTITFQVRVSRAIVGAAVLGTFSLPGRASDVDFIDMFRNIGMMQTSDGESLTANGSFLSTSLTTLGGQTYDSVVMSYGGPDSPLNLLASSGSPNRYSYQTAALPSPAAMAAAFPQGSYSYLLQPSGGLPISASFVLADDHYAASLPYLSGSSYSELQGMNAGTPISLTLSPFVVDGAASYSFKFFTVYDYTLGQFVFSDGFLPAGTGVETLAANTLMPGHSYAYELIFSSRMLLPSEGTEQAAAQVGFELRTSGLFSTAAAVPEPSSSGLLLAGLGSLLLWARRRP